MKKRLLSCVILSIAAFQLPVFADNISVNNWTDLNSAIQNNQAPTILLSDAINAASTDTQITSKATFTIDVLGCHVLVSHTPTININDANYSITGPGGAQSVIINEGSLTIYGTAGPGAVMDSNGSSSAAIFNGIGGLILANNLTINGGISMGSGSNSNGTLQIGINDNSTVTLNGATNSITGGSLSFGGINNVLNIAGGTLDTSGMTFSLTTGNTLQVSGGTVTILDSTGTPGSADTVWKGGAINLTSGSLAIKQGWGKAPTSQLYTQIGGALTLNAAENNDGNGSGYNLNLNNASSYITGGTVAIKNGSSLTFDNGQSNHAAITMAQATSILNVYNNNGNTSLTLDSGTSITGGTINIGVGAATNSALNLSAGSITGTNTTVNIGTTTAGSNGNTLTVSGTGNIDESATIVLNKNNNLNITGGTVTLNQSGTTGNDILNGTVNMSAGTLTADSITPSSTGTFNYSGGSVILGSDTAPTAPNGLHLLGVHNLTGGNIELRGSGKLTLDSADTWTDTNIANKGGAFTLDNLSHNTITNGTYYQTAGTTTLQNSSVLTMNLDAANSSLSGGNVVINNSTLNLSTTAGATVGASLSGNSAGIINKNGAGTLLLTGRNSGYYGNLNVLSGNVDFNASSGNTDSYISGTTTLAGGSSLNLNTNGGNVISTSNNISGGTVNKTGTGNYTVLAGSNGAINYTLNVTGGSMTVATNTGTTANFNAPVNVNSSTLLTSAANTNFNSGLSLDHGYLGILNGGFGVTGNLSVGSTVNTMNGAIATNYITGGNLNVGASGTSEYLIDISPKAGASDNYVIRQNLGVGGDITTTNPTGVITISDFKVIGAPTLVQSVNLKIFDASGTIDPGVSFTATDKTVTTALGQYGLTSNGGGNYTLGWKDFNPQVFRGQVATEAAYANQLTTNNIIFDHINLVSQQLLSEDKPNVYANENPLYAPYQYNQKDGGLWYKGFGNIERLQLSQGINTQNNMWGSLVGADFPIVELKHGWKMLPTAYVGYTGGYQTYSGVNMYQNGGQGGIMGSFYKGNFVTSILANAGGYYNDMSVAGTRDQTGNWFAGVAGKSAYNIKLPKDFILQPNMLLSYNAFGQQNWNSDFGGVGMSTGMLNGLNFGPGVNLILNKESWSIYATTQLMVNAMNGVTGTIEDVTLPSVKMGSTYIQYGLGCTKRIKDRLSMYGQVMFSNGVRTGVGFQGGLQWKL